MESLQSPMLSVPVKMVVAPELVTSIAESLVIFSELPKVFTGCEVKRLPSPGSTGIEKPPCVLKPYDPPLGGVVESEPFVV